MCGNKGDEEKMNAFAELVAKNKDRIREVANANTTRNSDGVPVLAKNDSWRHEAEWEEVYRDLVNKR